MKTRFLMRHTLLAMFMVAGTVASTCNVIMAQDAPAVPAANELIPLRAKWTQGEKLSYEMRIDGTINMQVSRNTPSPFSGVPLDIDMKMLGATTLETLKVDEMGTGTVAVSLDGLKVLAQSFGQKAEITMQDGETVFMLNGKRMGTQRAKDDAKNPNEPKKVEAPFSLEISDRGQILRAIAPEPKKVAKGEEKKSADASPLNFEQMAQSAFWRIVPALWPAQAVKIGDKWSSDIAWPPALVAVQENQGQAVTPPAQLGHFDFTLRNSENVAGRKRVSYRCRWQSRNGRKAVARTEHSGAARSRQAHGRSPCQSQSSGRRSRSATASAVSHPVAKRHTENRRRHLGRCR